MDTSYVPAVPYAPPATPPDCDYKNKTKYVFRTSYFPLREIVVSEDSELELGRQSTRRSLSKSRRIEFLSPIVSMVHAKLCADDNGVFLVDVGTYEQGSTHGTFLNGARVKPLKPVYLSKGDLITLGFPQSRHSITLILTMTK